MTTRDMRKFHVTEITHRTCDAKASDGPALGGASHLVWCICDLLTYSANADNIPSLDTVQAFATQFSLTPGNVDFEYGSWLRHNGFKRPKAAA